MPLTFNPYVSQYVPAPVEEFKQAASYFQNEYNENLLASEKFKTMMNSVKVLPGDKSRLASQLKGYESQLGELVSQGNWEDASLKVRNLATDFAGNYQTGEIGQLANSYKNYELYSADKQKLGNEYAAWNDDYLAYQRAGNINKDGSYRGYTYGGLGKQENHAKRADEVLGKIAEDGSITSGFKLNADGVTYTNGEHGMEGVGMKKLQSVANAKASIFLDTIEGKDFIKKTSFYAGRNLSAQEAHNVAADYLLKAGMNQLGLKTKDTQKTGFLPKYLIKQPDTDDEQSATTSYTDASGNPLAQNAVQELDKYELVGGQLMRRNNDNATKRESLAAYGGFDDSLPVDSGPALIPVDDADKVGQNLKTVLTQLRTNSQVGTKRPLSDERLLADYKEAMKHHANIPINTKDFNVQMQQRKAKQLSPSGDPLDMFSGRRVTLLDTPQNGGGKPGAAISDINNGELKALLKDKHTTVAVKNRSLTNPYGMPGAYQVVVTNHKQGKGEDKKFNLLVSASPEEESAMDFIGKVGNAAYSGAPQTDIPLGQVNGHQRVLRVVNDPRGGRFKQRLEQVEIHTGTGIDRILSTEDFDTGINNLYRKLAAPQLKKLRLASDSQGNAKGEDKDNNLDEDDE